MSKQYKVSPPTCSHCNSTIDRLEQQFELNGQIVCAQCAAAVEAEDGFAQGDDIAPSADLSALASASTRRSSGRSSSGASSYRPPARKKSSPVAMIAFGGGTLVLSAVLGLLYANGTLSSWMGQQKAELTGVKADNDLVARYNALMSSANELAQNRNFAEAAFKLREAKSIIDQNPKLPGASEAGELAITIAKYDLMAKGRPVAVPAPGAPAVAERPKKPGAKSDPQPAIEFMGSRNGAPSKPLPRVVPPADATTSTPAPADGGGLPAVVEAPIGALPQPRPMPSIEPKSGDVAPSDTVGSNPPAPKVPSPNAAASDALADDLKSNDPDQLASTGWDKMRGGDVDAADQLFKKSLQLAAGHAKSTVGQAVLPAFQQQPREAISRLEKLVAVRTARAAAINLSSLYLNDNPMRAARVLRDHLSTLKTPDEETVNYLGVALRQADRKGTSTAAMKDMSAYYELCETKLAATHPGKKRWGTDWIAPAEADRKKAALSKQRAVLDAAEAERRSTEIRAERARQQLKDRSSTISRDALFALRQGVAEAEKAAADAKKSADTARERFNALESPPLPDTIPIIEP